LLKEDVEILEDINYQEINLDEFVKENIVSDLGKPGKLAELKTEYQERYVERFRDIASRIRKKFSGNFLFRNHNREKNFQSIIPFNTTITIIRLIF